MRDLLFTHQHAARFQQLDNRLVGFEYGLAVVFGQTIVQPSLGVDVASLIEAIFDAGIKVVGAMGWSRVNRSCALLEGYVVGKHTEDLAIEERMLEGCTFQSASWEARYGASVFESSVLTCRFEQPFGNDVNLSRVFQSHIFIIRMESDCHGRRKRPRRGRPDDCVGALSRECGVDRFGLTSKNVLYPDTGTGVLLVLDFSFCQRGAIEDAPVDGTKSFVDESVLPEVKEDASDYRFVLR